MTAHRHADLGTGNGDAGTRHGDERARRPGFRTVARTVRAVAAHPAGWAGAAGAARRAAPRGWWHRAPFLPVPDADWWAMRTEVAYGASGGEPTVDELRDLFIWSARMRRWRRR